MKEELMTDITNREMKYFGSIKRHNTLIRSILEEEIKEGEREVHNDTSGNTKLRDG